MTANDIADMVEKEPYHTNLNRSIIAYFIRQQQAEIEALKADLKYWTDPCDPLCKPSICDCYQAKFAMNNKKELTDEEIMNVEKRLRNNGDFCELHFARAILRKAQEK